MQSAHSVSRKMKKTKDASNTRTTSGAFFSESLDELGNNISPGAMLPSATMTRAISPMRIFEKTTPASIGNALPKSSPRRLAGSDARSGSVLLWGSGWSTQGSQAAANSDDTMARRMAPQPFSLQNGRQYSTPVIDKEFEGEKILSAFGGYGHIFVINDSGEMIYSGNDSYPQHKMPPDVGGLRQVSCGQKHFMYLTEHGALLSSGDNSFGQLGYTGLRENGDKAEEKVPRAVGALSDKAVAAVACGEYHTVCITEQGDVFSWGRGMEGQLGHGRLETSALPRFVKHLAGKFIDAVAAGATHSAAVSADGSLYTWGDNTVGQLGLGSQAFDLAPGGQGAAGAGAGKRRVLPVMVEFGGREEEDADSLACVSVSCGWGHTACVTRDGSVWTFGFGGRGQLGHGDTANALAPRRVEALRRRQVHVHVVTCGSHVTGAVSSDGRVYLWGAGTAYRLGGGSDSDCATPVAVAAASSGGAQVHVTQLALAEDRVLAVAPLRLLRLVPPAGPVGVRTRVHMEGDALFAAAGKTKVAFDFSPKGALKRDLRLVRGVFDHLFGASGEGGEGAGGGGVLCEAPVVDGECVCVVEVSLDNGSTYSHTGLSYRFYSPPVITRLVPPLRPASGSLPLALYLLAPPPAGLTTATVRFTGGGGDVTEEREAAWNAEEGAFTCVSPPMGAGLISVGLSLTGQEYHDASSPLDYYEPPHVTGLLPDCLPLTAVAATIILHVTAPRPSLHVRFSGPPVGGDVLLSAVRSDAPAAVGAAGGGGVMEVVAAAGQSVGWVGVEVSADGLLWSRDGLGLTYYGGIQPQVDMPLALKAGGLLNALLDSSLFPAAAMQVKLGSKVVPAAFDPGRGGAVFTVPAYEEASMGHDPEAVPLWLSLDAREWIPCGMLHLIDQFELTDLKPPKSGKGGAPTAVSIMGSGFVDKGEVTVGFSMEGEEDQLVTAEVTSPEAISVTTPQLAAGQWSVRVSLNGPRGEFVECGTAFTAV